MKSGWTVVAVLGALCAPGPAPAQAPAEPAGLGLRAVRFYRAAGGQTVVQDPADARYPHLPRAAISADGIGHVLPLEDIAPALTKLVTSSP